MENKKFKVGDVVVDTTTHQKGKILPFPNHFKNLETNGMNESNSYYIRWVTLDYYLNVEYSEELVFSNYLEHGCEKCNYFGFNKKGERVEL